jgi:hypothetical protein
LQLNLQQADKVMFFKSLEEAVGSVEDMSTLYSAIGDAGLSSYLSNSKTVATLFAPSDDVSCAAWPATIR